MTFTTRQVAEIAIPDLTPPHPLYFVSDLHMGDGSPADDFAGLHEDAFWWWLEYVAREVSASHTIVMLGDLRELWQCKSWEVEYRYRFLDAMLIGSGATRRIRGNHDSADRHPKRFWWPNEQAPLILGEHLHIPDRVNARYSFIGRWLTALAGWLARLGWSGIEQVAWRKLVPSAVGRDIEHIVQAYATRVAGKFGLKLIVGGHTHRPLAVMLRGGCVLMNVGCWVSDDYAGSYGMVYQGKVSLWLVEEGGA